jgi:hypothetical protein
MGYFILGGEYHEESIVPGNNLVACRRMYIHTICAHLNTFTTNCHTYPNANLDTGIAG